jgi:hypothetical protein
MILNIHDLKNKFNCNFDGVLHIGAHYGEEYITYKKLNISPIIFIEALPNTYETLKSRVGEECICIQTAIGNTEGFIDMYVDVLDECGSSSVLPPKLHLQQYPKVFFEHKKNIPITKVDSLDIPQCNFMNIDIQGYELESLKGSEKYLNNVNYIMIEVNRDELYENCSYVDEIDQFLTKYGFVRVETDWAGNTWGDAFYMKKN